MSTPIKSASLVVKLKKLSPFSPQLSPFNTVKFLTKPNYPPSSNVKKKLNFHNEFGSNPLTVNENIQIRVSDCSESKFDNVCSYGVDVVQNNVNLFETIGSNGRIFDVIGRGTFGVVIRGIYKGREIAVKVVDNQKIIKERNALKLHHQNIIETLHIFAEKSGENGLIFMDYYSQSRQLQSVLDDDNVEIDAQAIAKFCTDIAKGLEFCHDHGILHLDLKPQNILLCSNDCKICDFGNSMKISELTENIHYKGTVAYTCPEILSGKRASTKSDIYSLGIVFWQIKWRTVPYSLINKEVVIYKVVKFNFRPSDCLTQDEDVDEFSALYRNCWHANPENRPDISDVLSKINRISLCYVS